MFERFTEAARQVVVGAAEEARSLGHDEIGTEHLLLGLLRDDASIATRALAALHVTFAEGRREVERIAGPQDARATGQIPFTRRARDVLVRAPTEATELGHDAVRPEHVLLALASHADGVAMRILGDAGADAAAVRRSVIALLPPRPPESTPAPAHVPHLLVALESAIATLLQQQRFEAAGELRTKQRRIAKLLREVREDLHALELDGAQPSTAGAEAERWEYGVATLEGAAETWPAQLAALRRDGWELLTVAHEGGAQRALLERRIGT